MLNLNGNNHLIELGCRNWWSDTNNARRSEKTAFEEEFLSPEHRREKTLPPASVFFAIELA